jgi:hypothetical protein
LQPLPPKIFDFETPHAYTQTLSRHSLGAIIGDSLGLATEGMTKSEINHVYGDGPIRFGMEDTEGVPFLRDHYRASFDEK